MIDAMDNPWSQIAFFVTACAAFVLPGYWWTTWLHRLDDYRWPMRVTLGFVWSFALFSVLATPFLWFGASSRAFDHAFAALWAVFVPLSFGLWCIQRRRARHPAEGTAGTVPRTAQASPGETTPSDRQTISQCIPRLFWVAFGGYAVIASVVVYLWSGQDMALQVKLLAASPLVLLIGSGLAYRFRRELAPWLRFTSDDDRAAPKAWSAVAVAVILLQAIGSTIYFRPDWDDCYYLAAVLDYQESPSLNDRDPTTRDLIGVNAPHRAMCLELWGAVLCRLAGTDPQTLFHSLLPGPLVLAAYAAYAALFGQIVPRRWIPLALIGLYAYSLWGIGEQLGAANHFLIRIWQGKAVLLHLALPMIAAMLIQFCRQGVRRSWLSLEATVCCALGFSSSAIYLGGILIGCLSLALLTSIRGGRVRFLVLSAVACLPLVAEGAAILVDSNIGVPLATDLPSSSGQRSLSDSLFWAFNLLFYDARSSTVGVLWLLTLPLSALLLVDSRRQAYPVLYPLILLVTFANPFFAWWIADHVCTVDCYYRLFWLFPVGPGLGVFFALLGRFVARTAEARQPVGKAFLPLAVVIVGALTIARLPGKYVWSQDNRIDSFMFPRAWPDVHKMSPDLRAIAGLLQNDPRVEEHPILCGEDVTSFLTPWSPRFRYILLRTFYLEGSGLDPSQRDATQRYFLSLFAHNGKFAEAAYAARLMVGQVPDLEPALLDGTVTLPTSTYRDGPRLSDVPRLLDHYKVQYIITSPPLWISGPDRDAFIERLLSEREELFQELGFRKVYVGQEHALWKRG